MNDSRHYFQSLQVFRGLAAIGVVLHHAGLFAHRQLGISYCNDVFDPGMIGVDFFFVLSGFIITSVHGQDIGKPDAAPTYLKRRFFRIYPLLLILTAVKLLIECVQGGQRSLGNILSSFLLLPPPKGEYPIITAAWTLQHEALFYGLFLLAILTGKRVALVLSTLWVALMVVARFGQIDGIVAFVLHPHHIEFLIGCLASLILARKQSRCLSPAIQFILLSVVLMLGKADALLWRAALGCAFAGLVLLGTVIERSWALPSVLRLFGDASYSIYLAHTPLLLGLAKASNHWVNGDLYRAHLAITVAVILSIAFGVVVYRLIERPLLDWSRKFSAKALPAS